MAIEIRELLIRATVTKNTSRSADYLSREEFRKEKQKILEECKERIREELEDSRLRR